MNTKPRIVKDYEKLDEETQASIKLEYPYGFEDNLIKFTNAEGVAVSLSKKDIFDPNGDLKEAGFSIYQVKASEFINLQS